MRTESSFVTYMGVAGLGFDPTAVGGNGASNSAVGWVMRTENGSLYHHGNPSPWTGQCKVRVGDVVVRPPPALRCAVLRIHS